MRTAAVTLMVCLTASALVAQTVKKPAAPVVAVVTDRNGHATTVTQLKATYAPREGSGGRAELLAYLPALRIQLRKSEGGVEKSETLSVPFAAIRRLSFLGDFKFEVERRDGTALVLKHLIGRQPDNAQFVLEERESAGGVTKNHRLYDYKFATEKQTGTASGLGVWRELLLMGFAGVIKSPSGRTRVLYRQRRSSQHRVQVGVYPLFAVIVSSPCELGPISLRRSSPEKNTAKKPKAEKIHMPSA